MDSFSWTCDICGKLRPDAMIKVAKHDITRADLPPGTVARNVKYCTDNPACGKYAQDASNYPRLTDPSDTASDT